jgi:hypothetical protein
VSFRPDWETRFLQPVLERALGLPIRSFLRADPATWVRGGSGQRTAEHATEEQVRDAIGAADLVVLHGYGENAPSWIHEQVPSIQRLLILPSGQAGSAPMPIALGPLVSADWYLSDAIPASPVAHLLAGLDTDEIPPLPALRLVDEPENGWVPLMASRGRRGGGYPIAVAGTTGQVILQKEGQTSVSATTDASGKVSLGSPFGDDASVKLLVKKDGFSPLVVQCPCAGMSYAISESLGRQLDAFRVVLNWGASPSDLDLHAVYPGNHIFFESKKGTDAFLDVDDTTSYGPETVTVHKRHDGDKYVFAIHNFSVEGRQGTRSLSSSGAKVFVYVGESLIRSFYVPTGKMGALWVVFAIDETGAIHDIDMICKTWFLGITDGAITWPIRIFSWTWIRWSRPMRIRT